jgi:YaiO family outer membrane protein
MIRTRLVRRLAIASVWILASALAASAQQDPAPESSPQQPGADVPVASAPDKTLTDYVEVGGSYRQLSNDFGDWSGGYARGVFAEGKNIWNGEINGQHEFGAGGVYMAAGDTYNFNPDWYGSLTLGSSVGGFFWPRFRADAFVNRKLLSRKQLIATLGYGYYASKGVHRDQSVFLGTTYYFQKPWIIEGGIRFNVSNPGVAFSPAGFVAVTEGRNLHHYITVNAGFGVEAYQIVGPSTVLSRFQSQNLTVTWRQWTGKTWGFNFVADYYHSPFYQRGGGSFGLFKQF